MLLYSPVSFVDPITWYTATPEYPPSIVSSVAIEIGDKVIMHIFLSETIKESIHDGIMINRLHEICNKFISEFCVW